ncbi:MAG: hypothetical protein PVF73_02780, partial [Bacteroidales bacterium]
MSDDEGGVSLIPQGERLTIEFKLFFLNGDLFCFLFYVDDKKGNRTVREQFEKVACTYETNHKLISIFISVRV